MPVSRGLLITLWNKSCVMNKVYRLYWSCARRVCWASGTRTHFSKRTTNKIIMPSVGYHSLITGNECGYSFRLTNLFENYADDKTLQRGVPKMEAKRRLVKTCDRILAEIEFGGNTLKRFAIGKTYVDKKRDEKFLPDNPETWKLKDGISGRWDYYEEKGYNGLVVIACIDNTCIPRNPRIFFDEPIVYQKEPYALALKDSLIRHYMFVDEDPRLYTRKLYTGRTWREEHKGAVLFLAFEIKPAHNTEIITLQPDEEYTISSTCKKPVVVRVSALSKGSLNIKKKIRKSKQLWRINILIWMESCIWYKSTHVAMPVSILSQKDVCWNWLSDNICIFFYQCRCYLLQFIELCKNIPNHNQFDTLVGMRVDFNQTQR